MDRADVIIFGGGLVGLALASALDSSGLSAIVVDPADPGAADGAGFDGRTSAVSSSSMRMLEAIGVADHLAEPGCPIRRIAVADGLEPGAIHFDPDDDEPLGFMHENRHLRAALHARAAARQEIWLMWKSRVTGVDRDDAGVVVSLEDGRKLRRRCWSPPTAATRALAKPRGSTSRAGNTIIRRSSRCSATSAQHEHVAYEIFYPSGPFALLPMNDDAAGTARRSCGRCPTRMRPAGCR